MHTINYLYYCVSVSVWVSESGAGEGIAVYQGKCNIDLLGGVPDPFSRGIRVGHSIIKII